MSLKSTALKRKLETRNLVPIKVSKLSPTDDIKTKNFAIVSVEDVCLWLDRYGLIEYIDIFKAKRISWRVLVQLTESLLEELGIGSKLDQIRIRSMVQDISELLEQPGAGSALLNVPVQDQKSSSDSKEAKAVTQAPTSKSIASRVDLLTVVVRFVACLLTLLLLLQFKKMDGTSVYLDFVPDETVSQLKQRFRHVTGRRFIPSRRSIIFCYLAGIPADQQRYVIEGRQVDSALTVKAVGITPNSIITVVPRLRGS